MKRSKGLRRRIDDELDHLKQIQTDVNRLLAVDDTTTTSNESKKPQIKAGLNRDLGTIGKSVVDRAKASARDAKHAQTNSNLLEESESIERELQSEIARLEDSIKQNLK